jgi:hypothetical protein
MRRSKKQAGTQRRVVAHGRIKEMGRSYSSLASFNATVCCAQRNENGHPIGGYKLERPAAHSTASERYKWIFQGWRLGHLSLQPAALGLGVLTGPAAKLSNLQGREETESTFAAGYRLLSILDVISGP